jgi:hypothetical protein
MDRRRVWLVSASFLFAAWVAILAIMAVKTGRKPVAKAPVAKARLAPL